MEREFCHNCLHNNIKTKATTERYWENAFGNADNYWVPLCDECATESDDWQEFANFLDKKGE